MRYIHQECLETWLIFSHKRECEICGHRFVFESVYSGNPGGKIARPLILKAALAEALLVLDHIWKTLLVIVIWIFLTPYSAKCLWTFYFNPSPMFKFISAILCRLYGGSCGIFLVMTQNPDLLEIFPSLSNLLAFFLDSKISNASWNYSISPVNMDPADPMNSMQADRSQEASKYLLQTISRRFSMKVIAYDVLYGQVITVGVLLSAVAFTFIRDHMSFDPFSDSGADGAEAPNVLARTPSPVTNNNTTSVDNTPQYNDDYGLFTRATRGNGSSAESSTERVRFADILASYPHTGSDDYSVDTDFPINSDDDRGMFAQIACKDECCAEHGHGNTILATDGQSSDDSAALVSNDGIEPQDPDENGDGTPDIDSSQPPAENSTTNQTINTQGGHDFMYLTGMRENIDDEPESEFFTILGILGVNGRISNIIKNFVFTNIIIATFVGGIMWIPYCLSSLIIILSRDLYIPLAGRLISALFHGVLTLLGIDPATVAQHRHTIISGFSHLVFKLIHILRSAPLKMNGSSKISIYTGSQLSSGALYSVLRVLEGSEHLLDTTLESVAKNGIRYPFENILISTISSASEVSGAAITAISPSKNTITYLSDAYSAAFLRAGSVIATIFIKKIIIIALVLFHMRRIGWLGQFNRISIVDMLKKTLKFILKASEVAFVFFLSMIVLPVIYGIISDILTLSAFGPTVTADSRWRFAVNYPLTSRFIYWVVGTALMTSFVYYFSTVRSVLRSGILWFVKDPIYPRRGLSDILVNQPFHSSMYKALSSAVLYACTIVICLGGFVAAVHIWDSIFSIFTRGGGPSQIWPLQWDLSDSPFILPFDLIFFYFFAMAAMEKLKPLDTLKDYIMLWFLTAGKLFRLTHFLTGFRQSDEESEPDEAFLKRSRGFRIEISYIQCIINRLASRRVSSGKKREYRFMRMPSNDNVVSAPGKHMYLPLRAIPPMYDIIGESKLPGLKDWTVVYVPPYFKTRLFIVVLLNWMFNITLLLIFSATSLTIGRYAFNTAFRILGCVISQATVFSTILRISPPAEPFMEYFDRNNVDLPNNSGNVPRIYKSVLLSLLLDLKGHNVNHLQLLKGNISEAAPIIDKINSVYGMSNHALLSRPLWDRIIRPDLAVHDTYSFIVGVYILFLCYKFLRLIWPILSFIFPIIAYTLKLVSYYLTWVCIFSVEKCFELASNIVNSRGSLIFIRKESPFREKISQHLKFSVAKVKSSKIRYRSKSIKRGSISPNYIQLASKYAHNIPTNLILPSMWKGIAFVYRAIILGIVVTIIPTLIGLAFETGVLRSLAFALNSHLKKSIVLSLAKIPKSWLESKSRSEIFIYVFTNEWAFGAILLRAIYSLRHAIFLRSRVDEVTRALSARGLIGNLQPVFLRSTVLPITIACLTIIISPIVIKTAVFKMLYLWIVVIRSLLLTIRTGSIIGAHRFFYEALLTRLQARSGARNTGKDKLDITFSLAISLMFLAITVAFVALIVWKYVNKYIQRIKAKARSRAFLVGHRLHNLDSRIPINDTS